MKKRLIKEPEGLFSEGSLVDPMPSIMRKMNEDYKKNELIYKEVVKSIIIEAGFPFNENLTVQVIGMVLFESDDTYFRFQIHKKEGEAFAHRFTNFVQYREGKLEIRTESELMKIAGWVQQFEAYTGADFR